MNAQALHESGPLERMFDGGMNGLGDLSDDFRSHVSKVLRRDFRFEKYRPLGSGCCASVVHPIDTPLAIRMSQKSNERPEIGEVLQSLEDFWIPSPDDDQKLRIEILPLGTRDLTDKEVKALFVSSGFKGYYWGAHDARNAVRLPETGKAYIADVDEMHKREDADDDFAFLWRLPIFKQVDRLARSAERAISMCLDGCSPRNEWSIDEQRTSAAYAWHARRRV